MKQWTPRQEGAALEVIKAGSQGNKEEPIRAAVANLFKALDPGLQVELEYSCGRKRADIYLANKRCLVETKANSLEGAWEQLEDYVHVETERTLGLLWQEGGSDPWIAIVTNGVEWEFRTYPHRHDATGSPTRRLRASESQPKALLEQLDRTLSPNRTGLPWAPRDPAKEFTDLLERLDRIHRELPSKQAKEAGTKLHLWKTMLEGAGMAPSEGHERELFIQHSYLVALARAVIEAVKPEKNREPVSLEGFPAWIQQSKRGRDWLADFTDRVQGFNWGAAPGDVLRPFYEAVIDPGDRKAFGEYYTPDWLAELIVQTVLDEEWLEESVRAASKAIQAQKPLQGIGVLDPACGSGTFLWHAAKRILGCKAIKELTPVRKADIICRLVNGIDIHPVAAEIARATIMRALPSEPTDGKAAIRIHEGDALTTQAMPGGKEPLIQDSETIRFHSKSKKQVEIPRSLVRHPSFAELMRRIVVSAGQGEKSPPEDTLSAVPPQDRTAVDKVHGKMKEIIQEEGNSVWAWYITNITAPYKLSERKIDRIVANPPWVGLSGIQAETRKRSLEEFAKHKEIALWTGGKQAPHLDIAQLFIKRCRRSYMMKPRENPAGWLVKKAALQGGNWKLFRKWQGKDGERHLRQSIDLETLQPFGGGDARRPCILLEHCDSSKATSLEDEELTATPSDPKDRPKPWMKLEEAKPKIAFAAAEPPIPEADSEYLGKNGKPLARSGAILAPHVLIRIEESRPNRKTKTTTVLTRKSIHAPWKGFSPCKGELPQHWLREVLDSKSTLPFAFSKDSPAVIVPTNKNGALESVPEEVSPFWKELEEAWKEGRSRGASTPDTLLGQIDWAGKLSSQLDPRQNWKGQVVHPSSGDMMRACRTNPKEFLVDVSLYRLSTQTWEEAGYLTAILNASCLDKAFKQSRESGRHFHQHFWRKIPIPRFNPELDSHQRLAELCAEAEAAALPLAEKPGGQVKRSARIRETLQKAEIMNGINRIVQKLLPDQAR